MGCRRTRTDKQTPGSHKHLLFRVSGTSEAPLSPKPHPPCLCAQWFRPSGHTVTMATANTWSVRLHASPQNVPHATVQDDSGFHNAAEDQTRQQAGTRGQNGPHAHCVPKKATAVHEASFTAYRAQGERETSKETPGGSKQRNPKSRTTGHIPQHHRPGLFQRLPLRGGNKGDAIWEWEMFSDFNQGKGTKVP